MSETLIDRTSHISIVENPDIKSFLSSCNYMKVPVGNEIEEIASLFISRQKAEYQLPNRIISIDGSNYEASIRKELPFTRVGFVKISSMLIKRNEFKNLAKSGFVDPFEVAKLSNNNSAISFCLPGANLKYKNASSVRDGFRQTLDEQLYTQRFVPNDPSTSIRTTLFRMASIRKDDSNSSKMILHKCPTCGEPNLELLDIPETQRCPICKSILYPSDCLRIWEDITDSGSIQSALTRFTNAISHLLIVHYVRYLKESCPDSYLNNLSGLCFIIDGPLAIFGNPAWLHSSIMKYLFNINQELIRSKRTPIMVMGVMKNGPLCDYFRLINHGIPNNSIYAVSDEFREKYVNCDKVPSSSTFGSETYYGQDFLIKTGNGRLFAFDVLLPFERKSLEEGFKQEKSNILNYHNIGVYSDLIEEFECDLYSNTLVPIALAQKYTSISLEPGGRVLDLLSKQTIESKQV